MRRTILPLALFLLSCLPAAAQEGAPKIFVYGTSLAGVKCNPNQRALWIVKSGVAAGVYRCSAVNTFTNIDTGTTLTDSASLRSALSDETGTGAAVFAASPTIVTPTIASLANANHNHTNAAGGGQLTTAALSDYATNTCTLALTFGGASTGITYSAQTCKYTQVGNVVTVDAALILSSKGSATGGAVVTGLPVAATSTANRYQYVSGTIHTATFSGEPFLWISPTATTSIQLYNVSGASRTPAELDNTHFTNTTTIFLNFHYKTN